MSHDPRIAIVGGGIGGMTAALSLAHHGFRPVLHERAAELGEVGAGLQLGPNAMRVLSTLGAAEAVLEMSDQPARVVLRDGLTGRAVGAVPMGRGTEARYGAAYVQAHRADLLEVLAAKVRSTGIELRLGAEVIPGEIDADIIVAADGVRSVFRDLVAPGHAPEFTGQVAWRALLPGAAVTLDNETHVFMGPGGHVVAYPLRGGAVWNLVAVREQASWVEEGWALAGDLAELRDGFAGWCAEVTALLGQAVDPIRWGLFAHDALPRWQDGRTVLLGDACHPMLPFMAQGAAMAIEDAWVLGACLARSGAPLERYEALRKPRATRVQRQSWANARIYHMRPGPVRRALHLGMRAQDLFAPRALLRRFDWLYGEDVTSIAD